MTKAEDIKTLTLAEALAVRVVYANIAYPNKAQKSLLHEAKKIVDAHGESAAERFMDGLCTECWGDGFHRVGNLLAGPCHKCNGAGRVVSSLMAGKGEDSVSPERMAQLLKARIDRCAELEAALKPYVVDYDEWMDTHSDSEMMSTYRRVTYGEHRAALRALTEQQ